MRDGWVETTLGDVADVLSGFAFKSDLFNENDGIPLIRIRDLHKKSWTEVGYTGEFDDRYLVGQGDLLIGMDGEFRCYEWLGERALLNQRVCRIQDFDEKKIVPRFVYFLVNSYLEEIEDSTSFTTVKHISVKQVKGISFPRPPLVEQRRIVDLVSSVDAYIDSLQQQVDSARKARNAVLHELLSAGGDEWTETTLGDVAEVLDRMRKPVSGAERAKRQGQVPYYGATGQAGWIDAAIFDEELVLLGEDAIDFLNPMVHKAYLISGPSWVNNHAHVLRARKHRVLSFFLMEALNAVDYSQFVAFGTRSKLTQGAMMDITINLPPLVEQKRIVETISSMDDGIEASERAVAAAKNLRSGLLSDLLSGEHEIPKSYDELMGDK